MEDELRHSKNELVLNSQQIQKFMEDGTKTTNEYIIKYEQAQELIGYLQDEITVKENLILNKDEVYQRVLDDLQEARKNIGVLQIEKLEIDSKKDNLQDDLNRVKEEKTQLEERLIELDSAKYKIKKQNALIDELNTKFYGLSIDELGSEINSSLFKLVLTLRHEHLSKIIENSMNLNSLLEQENRHDLVKKLSQFKDIIGKENEDIKENDKEDVKVDKVAKTKPKVESKGKVSRTGGGFALAPDSDDDKKKEQATKDAQPKPEDKNLAKDEKNAKEQKNDKDVKVEKKIDPKTLKNKKKEELSKEEWTAKVKNAQLTNPKLRKLLIVSKVKVKDKDGKWNDKNEVTDLDALIQKTTKDDPESLFAKIFKEQSKKLEEEKRVKEQQEKHAKEESKLNQEIDKLSQENNELKERTNAYSVLLASTVSDILNYVSDTKDGIQKIESNYTGFFSLKDKELGEKIMEDDKSHDKKDDIQYTVKSQKRQIADLNDQLNHMKIMHEEVEGDLEKYIKKDKVNKTKHSHLRLENDDLREEYESRLDQYKHALYEKDEEMGGYKESARVVEKQLRDALTKSSGSNYELESTKRKLEEAKHHQDMLTKKIREYEEVVRLLNKNIKKNSNQSTESNITGKHKEKEIGKYRMRFKVLEDELHNREKIILSLKSKVAKISKDFSNKEGEVNKMITRKYNDSDVLQMDKKNREFNSQIEVLKEMIVGLKTQLKAKDMDTYRLQAKTISLQAQIDTMRVHERQLQSYANMGNKSVNYSPAISKNKLKSPAVEARTTQPKTVSNYKGSDYKKESRGSMRSSATKPKTLVKADTKVQKKTKEEETTDLMAEIMQYKSKNAVGSVQSSKPNILISAKKSSVADDNDVESVKKSSRRMSIDDDDSIGANDS